MNEDHPEHKIKHRDPAAIRPYFSFLKSYLRSQGIRINADDVRDFIQFPTKTKEPRKALGRDTIKLILEHSSPKRKALYLTLLSSAMRVGEALALRKRDFDFSKNPVTINIPAKYTKNKRGRETFITNEARKYVERLVKKKKESDLVFTDIENIREAVDNEGDVFSYLRKKIGLTEKYPDSVRHVYSIHSFRSFFYTAATHIHDSDYAHALLGHSPYMSTYYRLLTELRAKMYLELEPKLTIDDSERLKIQNQKLKEEKSELEKQIPKLVNDAVDRIKEQLRQEGSIVNLK